MKTENKIIKLFIEERKSFTIRELSKRIRADYRITHIAAQRLLDKKILSAEKVGKSLLCRLKSDYYGVKIYTVENERRQKLLKNRNINQLYKEIMSKTKTGFFIFLIFGSYAKGKQTRASDIDMMFISNEKGFEEKMSNILSLLPLKTHALVFTEQEFVRMKDAKKPNVVREAIANNIILYGVENYYRIKNA